jgi:hypothetical protein
MSAAMFQRTRENIMRVVAVTKGIQVEGVVPFLRRQVVAPVVTPNEVKVGETLVMLGSNHAVMADANKTLVLTTTLGEPRIRS